jgi:hypothetical protein
LECPPCPEFKLKKRRVLAQVKHALLLDIVIQKSATILQTEKRRVLAQVKYALLLDIVIQQSAMRNGMHISPSVGIL